MPMYTWEHQETGEQITVIRKFNDIENHPTEEECVEMRFVLPDSHEDSHWRRIMCAPSVVKGWNWGGGKGSW